MDDEIAQILLPSINHVDTTIAHGEKTHFPKKITFEFLDFMDSTTLRVRPRSSKKTQLKEPCRKNKNTFEINSNITLVISISIIRLQFFRHF